ncbi:hypothetical protein V2J09_024026 [Rumex salicifolius]
MEGEGNKEAPIFRDIRRYYCQYCGICRSKKSLITSHVLSNHQEEMKEKEIDEQKEGSTLNVCEDCGAEFKKPAHLKQHMLTHSLERKYTCPVDDCNSSYIRKDHLNRHLLQHEGKLFKCPIENCKKEFTIKANIARHVKEMHDENHQNVEDEVEKKCICSEKGCGKEFKYESRLRKHMESHIKLDSVEAFCADPSCMKPFSNIKCLNEHIRSCHQHVTCDICGSKHLRKNIKRHMRTHDEDHTTGTIKCTFDGCDHTFAKGDLEEFDEQFMSRPRGGRKRSCPNVDSLLRKRVVPPSQSDSAMKDSASYMSWLLSSDNEEQI